MEMFPALIAVTVEKAKETLALLRATRLLLLLDQVAAGDITMGHDRIGAAVGCRSSLYSSVHVQGDRSGSSDVNKLIAEPAGVALPSFMPYNVTV